MAPEHMERGKAWQSVSVVVRSESHGRSRARRQLRRSNQGVSVVASVAGAERVAVRPVCRHRRNVHEDGVMVVGVAGREVTDRDLRRAHE